MAGEEIICAECGEGVSDLSHHLAHTHTHFPRPLPIIGSFRPLHTGELEMSGASSWQPWPVNEQGESATKAQRTGKPQVSGYAASTTTAPSAGCQISGPTPISMNEDEKGGSTLKGKGRAAALSEVSRPKSGECQRRNEHQRRSVATDFSRDS